MSELNAEQIKKALECCISGDDCTLCPLINEQSCPCVLNENALALINSQEQRIKELTEDNEYLKTQLTATEARYESRKESDIAEKLELRLKVEELTKENGSWQKTLMTEKENASKAYYNLACEVEDLRAENAKYEAEHHAEFNKWLKLEEATKRHHAELFKDAKIAVKEDTVREFVERLNAHFYSNCAYFRISHDYIRRDIDKIAKEMLEDKLCT